MLRLCPPSCSDHTTRGKRVGLHRYGVYGRYIKGSRSDHDQGYLRQRDAMVLGLSRETSRSSVISGAASPAGAASICSA